ncbi:hypothetical protein GS458_3301 [Geobacillus stearothermophilus]|nr:hypothetical protein GS458_3301 [Geobacillus stearothermophilus]
MHRRRAVRRCVELLGCRQVQFAFYVYNVPIRLFVMNKTELFLIHFFHPTVRLMDIPCCVGADGLACPAFGVYAFYTIFYTC